MPNPRNPNVHQWSRSFAPEPSPNAPPVRVLMEAGKWKVPEQQRPSLAPPPRAHKPESCVTTIRGIE